MRHCCLAAWLSVPQLLGAAAGFDPVKDLPMTLSGGALSMVIPRGVHLKLRTFRIGLASGGDLRPGILPPASGVDEDGEPIWRGTVVLRLKGEGLEDPVRLTITYQPCTEGPDGVCFRPVKRNLTAPSSEIPAEPRPAR